MGGSFVCTPLSFKNNWSDYRLVLRKPSGRIGCIVKYFVLLSLINNWIIRDNMVVTSLLFNDDDGYVIADEH